MAKQKHVLEEVEELRKKAEAGDKEAEQRLAWLEFKWGGDNTSLRQEDAPGETRDGQTEG